MIRDSFHTNGFKNKIKVWFSSTRWRPDDVMEQFPHVSNDMSNFVKYDPECDSQPRHSHYCSSSPIALYRLL